VEAPSVTSVTVRARSWSDRARRAWRLSALRDYLRSVIGNSREDDIFFLAGGVAFSILLAAVPFLLLLVSGLGYFLNLSPAASLSRVSQLMDQLLPPTSGPAANVITSLMNEAIRVRGKVGLLSAVTFIWFSTRLFGSLRAVLAVVFDLDHERGIIEGKLFDAKVTVVATLAVVVYTIMNAYLALATTRWQQIVLQAGVRAASMSQLTVAGVRVLEVLFVVGMFFACYKFLPSRRIRAKTAGIAAVFGGVLLEIAKIAFSAYLKRFNPGSLFTGTLATIVIVIIWLYYGAIIFILGGEVGQAYELRRVRRLQRVAIE
jgi:membrane protein